MGMGMGKVQTGRSATKASTVSHSARLDMRPFLPQSTSSSSLVASANKAVADVVVTQRYHQRYHQHQHLHTHLHSLLLLPTLQQQLGAL